MFIIILSIFLTIIALFAASAQIVRPKEDRYADPTLKFKVRARTFLGFLPLLIILLGMFETVPVNSVGIVFNQFTGVQDNVMQEGFHAKSPFETYYIISTEVRTKTVTNVSGQTKDAQWINITMDIKYRVSQSNAFEVFKRFKDLDNVDTTLLSPLVQRAIESVTTKYNVIDILGDKRNEVYILIENEVKTRLAESGIEFFSLVLTDTDAGEAIEAAIEAEAVAKKQVETALQAQAKAEIEAQTKVLQAEAAAKVTLIEAQTAADANKLLSFSITPEILKKMEMEARIKWGWVTIQTGSAIVNTAP